MSYNDRLREASVWVAAHPEETVLLAIPRQALADALWEAADDCRWPHALSQWARDLARNTRGMCPDCWDASVPLDWWEERQDWVESQVTNPSHANCEGGSCTCPCRKESNDHA